MTLKPSLPTAESMARHFGEPTVERTNYEYKCLVDCLSNIHNICEMVVCNNHEILKSIR